MKTKLIKKDTSFDLFLNTIRTFEAEPSVKGILIFASDADGYTPEGIDSILKSCKLPVFGGVFPQIIFQNKKYDEGTLIIGLEQKPDIFVVQELSNTELVYEDQLKVLSLDEECKTAFILVDGLAMRIAAFIESFFNIFGLEFNTIGGGAGSLSFVQKPCLFTNEGLIQDAAVIATFNVASGVGVKHGWQELSGPYKVSSSNKNVLSILDNESAFTLYKRVVEEDSKKIITRENFFDIAKAYPFGISRLGAEKIVRDPISVEEDGSMIFVGEIPNGVYLHILKGEVDSLVDAAEMAYKDAEKDLNSESENKSIVFIDCISRVLFLENDFDAELNAVYDKDLPMIGILTLGEIANSGKDYLEFYNKTAVVSIIENL
jgi:hypothetical protein